MVYTHHHFDIKLVIYLSLDLIMLWVIKNVISYVSIKYVGNLFSYKFFLLILCISFLTLKILFWIEFIGFANLLEGFMVGDINSLSK